MRHENTEIETLRGTKTKTTREREAREERESDNLTL